MSQEKRDAGEYVRQVHESTQQYTRDVLRENERLVGVVASLQESRLRLEAEVCALQERLQRHDQVQTTLLEQIASMESTTRAFTARYLEVEQQSANLANLYVASYRLHGSLDRADVLVTMHEILINLIGSEEFAIFERSPDGASLQWVSSCGVEEGRLAPIPFGEGTLGTCIARGALHLPNYDADGAAVGPSITACIPLRIGERVIGAIVVYRLLAHKPALEESDIELFHLLATHAATAIYCSELHARAAGGERA